MEKSPCSTTTDLQLVLHPAPCGLLFILTIIAWCVSRIQSCSCQSCSHNPSCKATPAPVLTENEVIKTRKKNHDDELETITYEDINTVMKSIGLSSDHESSMACSGSVIGSRCITRIFDDDEPSLHEVRQAFLVFDENKDGFFDASDLQRVFQSLGFGEGVGLGECEKMIAKYDVDKDRRIDLVEFTKVLEASMC